MERGMRLPTLPLGKRCYTASGASPSAWEPTEPAPGRGAWAAAGARGDVPSGEAAGRREDVPEDAQVEQRGIRLRNWPSEDGGENGFRRCWCCLARSGPELF